MNGVPVRENAEPRYRKASCRTWVSCMFRRWEMRKQQMRKKECPKGKGK